MNVSNAKPAHDESYVKNEESGNWHKRLRLRKNSFSFSTFEQNTVKQEKKITNQKHARKAWETSEKPPEGVQNGRAVDKSRLAFSCSACSVGTTFRPGELIVHYKTTHAEKAPVFSCEMCGFSTAVFSTLQHHRIMHKDCLFNCEVCNDNIQHTFPHLIKHCQSLHTLRGLYHCQTCKISVKDIEQFVCHLCPPATDLFKNDEHTTNGRCKSRPMAGAAGSAQKEDLLKHLAAACRQRWSRRNWWRKREPATKPDDNLSHEFKFLHPKQEPPVLPISAAGLLDNHGVLLDPEKTLEETQQFLERTVGYGKKWPVFLKTEQDVRNTGKDKLRGLMEKNNISVPPHCSTKVVGFKMVNGKKHVVLKVISSSKRDFLAPGRSKCFVSGTCSQTPNRETCAEHGQSKPVSTNCSSSQTEKHGRCEDEQEKQQRDGQHTDTVSTHISRSGNEFNLTVATHQNTKELRYDFSSESRPVLKRVCPSAVERVYGPDADKIKKCPALGENFSSTQRHSDCHSDLTSCPSLHTGSSEDTCHSPFVIRNPAQASTITGGAVEESPSQMEMADSCVQSGLISEFDCVGSAAGSPLNDLGESLCGFESGLGDVLFHSSVDESTNNMDPRDALLPVGQYDGEMFAALRGTYSTAADQLPLTTVRHLLDEADADVTFSSDNTTDCLTSHAAESHEHSVSLTSLNESALNHKQVEVLLEDSQEHVSKSQKRSGPEESDITASITHWEPVPRDVPRSLRLKPFCSLQTVRLPHDNQPVVVLNHPNADIPEVTNIMKVVHKHKGAVQRVVLSEKTLAAVSDCDVPGCRKACPDGTVKERFSLILRLKRVCGRKFTVVPTVSESIAPRPTFRCWFCGRLFQNQEVWVGHGQRHLTEATRDWNQLFNR